ncbi:olfactory receptor 1020-like [Sphaerodactylus townsendi]|uniref:olfactory receptor 1020-like n=1 Tax=Sphaerodactylus townsendi TaxID=933632 RepID=UPI00202619A2|nr:olfactory receptor 1020-like [Sphaerodactylus townsendi]XP_048342674.1 olfactory receptor 1020-like [Sphaerodactylus townsendi]
MNQNVTEFILLGFMDHPELQVPLFMLFLIIYLTSLVGNIGIIILTKIDAQLHTPMYFFLRNLSIVDIGYSTAIGPKLLATFVTEGKSISFTGCAVQFYFFALFITTEGCLLAVMAYDRFIAICNPLLYFVIMSKKFCTILLVGAYTCGFASSSVQTILIFRLSFCNSNIINHFFCDVPSMLKLSCSDIHVTHTVHFILSTIIALTTFLIVLISYIAIVFAILKIHSAQGKFKAFSTCASHLTTVTIFFGTIMFMYIRPGSNFSVDQDKIVSMFYTLVISFLNPLIYSLRNKDVKDAVNRIAGRVIH